MNITKKIASGLASGLTTGVMLAAALLAPSASPSVFAQGKAPGWPTERPPRPLAAKSVKFPPYEMRRPFGSVRIS